MFIKDSENIAQEPVETPAQDLVSKKVTEAIGQMKVERNLETLPIEKSTIYGREIMRVRSQNMLSLKDIRANHLFVSSVKLPVDIKHMTGRMLIISIQEIFRTIYVYAAHAIEDMIKKITLSRLYA